MFGIPAPAWPQGLASDSWCEDGREPQLSLSFTSSLSLSLTLFFYSPLSFTPLTRLLPQVPSLSCLFACSFAFLLSLSLSLSLFFRRFTTTGLWKEQFLDLCCKCVIYSLMLFLKWQHLFLADLNEYMHSDKLNMYHF